MEKSMELDIDPSIFGYRWTEAEKHMIFFDGNTTEDFSTSAPVGVRVRPPQNSRQSMLESLSLEVLHIIVKNLDLGSLAALSSVSFFMSEVVRSLPAFRDLTTYAPQALKALGRTRLVRQHGIMQLHRALRSTLCSYCNMYGPYLYLLKCTRCCYLCMRREERLISTPLNKAKRILEPLDLESKSLPKLLTPPGMYTYESKIWKKRLWLVSWDDVCSMLPKSLEKTELLQGCELPFYVNHEDLSLDQSRFYCHVVVAFPSITQTGDKITNQHGLWCRGCEDNWYFSHQNASYDERRRLYAAQEMAYSHIEFTEHCKGCSGIKRLQALNYPDFTSVPEYRRYVQRS